MQSAAEELVSDFALKQLNLSIKRNETQEALNVPRHLIFLAAVSLATFPMGENNGFDDRHSRLFSRLQGVHYITRRKEHESDDETLFALTPKLLPSTKLLNRVDQELKRKNEQQQKRANKAAAELVSLEEKTTKSAKKKIKKKAPVVLPKQDTNDDYDNKSANENIQPQIEDTLKELTRPYSVTVDKIVLESSDWMQVCSRKSRLREGNQYSTEPASEKAEMVEEKASNTKDATNATGNSGKYATSSEVQLEQKLVNSISDTCDSSQPESDSDELWRLKASVETLELQMASRDNTIEELRAELKQKQERYDERLQSLQLRLYISETQLKTYEDALEDHVKAVRSNIASSRLTNT